MDAEPVVGFHPVREALRARRRRLRRLVVRSGLRRPELGELRGLARAAGVPVEELDADALARLAPGARTQGLVLEAGPLPPVPLEELFAAGPAGGRCLVALDGVEDPQNVGALLRAADAAGASGAILPERHAPPLGAAVSRASAGALEHLPIARVVNLARALGQAKERGFWVVALDPEGGEDLFAAPDRVFEGDLALVVGGEEQGVRHGIRRLADHRVSIPMRGRVHSLNVAAAAAVALFEWARRRTPRGAGGPGS
ncbi:MAG TPA: 23S rRNA (guanosine(2251)-2'-O)-methyltransferase RlmB [Myxococcota bacterium]|nr:23S rRNA (guanosine(2251)-2'-O)-methyltransferase RlmB [Myxococcota bacterium]